MSTITESEIRNILAKCPSEPAPHAFMGGCKEVLIYGAGGCGKDVLRLLQAEGIKVRGFLDSCLPLGSMVADFQVWHPADAAVSDEDRSGCCVIVGVFNAHVDIASLVATLRSYGYQHIITFVEFFRYFPAELGDRFWLTRTSFYAGRESEMAAGGALLSDLESRQLYLALLAYRMTGDYDQLAVPSTGTQYFDHSLPRWNTPVSFIDCGSYTGDTIVDLNKQYGPVDTLVAFEPDLDNFARLAAMMRCAPASHAQQLFLYPCGVWSETVMLSFAADVGTSSALSSQGTSTVQCMALDDALPGFRPTLIKMDIEGAELHALNGARSMITESRPGLAISAYHTPEHLWEVTLLLHSWALDYRFYLRCYGQAGFDTVLYAFPG